MDTTLSCSFPFVFQRTDRYDKYSWIEVECKKAREKLNRKESYKINPRSLRLIDDSLSNPEADWEGRNEWLLPMMSKSIEELNEKWNEDRTSLGLVCPKAIHDFVLDEIRDDADRDSTIQLTLDGTKAIIAEPMGAVMRYRFNCHDNTCNGHRILCEDWELLEAWRKWRGKYESDEVTWEKIHSKFYDWMTTKRDLYFYMGMYYNMPYWLIIGLYYPPKMNS